MAFNATEWRDLLSDYSGSTAGTRSWSALGESQAVGKYYLQLFKSSTGGSNYAIKARIRGCQPSNSSAKNVSSFYSVAGNAQAYRTSFNAYYGFFTSTSFTNGTLFSTPSHVYTLGNVIDNVTDTSYYGFSVAESTFWSAGNVTTMNGAETVEFYNFSPWGAPPYSGGSPGSNVAIGRGPSGTPSSGYPYQRYYLPGNCP